MKKQLLLLFFILLSITGYSQTYGTLPVGSKPYGNQLYIDGSNGNIYGGTSALKYRIMAQKRYVDSLLATLSGVYAPINGGTGYIWNWTGGARQTADININGYVEAKGFTAWKNDFTDYSSLTVGAAEASFVNSSRNGIVFRGNLGQPIAMFNDTNGGADRTGIYLYEDITLFKTPPVDASPTTILTMDATSKVIKKIDAGRFVTYSGATGDVDLGAYSLKGFGFHSYFDYAPTLYADYEPTRVVLGNGGIFKNLNFPFKDGTFATTADITTNAVADIAALQAYNGLSTTIIVQHSLRGGTFNLKTGLTPDGGTVFEATGLGAGYYWQRDMSQADGYHVDWFGAIPYPRNNYVSGDFDSRAAFIACRNARPNGNTNMILGYGVYMLSDSVTLGEGTWVIGKGSLWPRQYFGDGSVYIDYTNRSAVRFYNTTNNGFATTSAVVSYRSQGIGFFKLGIFGAGRQYNKTGIVLHRTENSTSPAKTTGLVNMEDVYFADWGTGADGKNSTDTWYSTRNHFADVKVGLVGGSGQTFLKFTDFFKIDSIGAILNSSSEPDEMSGGEIETRYSANAAIIVNGRALIHDTQFLTNKKSIVLSSTANHSVITDNHFHSNSDTEITLTSGATDIQINGNHFYNEYTTNAGYNYAFVLEPLNTTKNNIFSTGARVQINSNYFTKNTGTWVGAPVSIVGGIMAASGNTLYGFTYQNEREFVLSGGATIVETYTAGRLSLGSNNNGTQSKLTVAGETEDDAAISSIGYGVVPTFVSRSAGGTAASPTTTLNGANLGQWKAQGYLGGFVTRASLDFSATENWTSTAKGTAVSMYVTPIGENGRIPMWRTSGKGTAFGLNTSRTATAFLHTDAGTSASGTAPFKMETGVQQQTVVERGAFNWDGTDLFIGSGASPVNRKFAFTSDLANYLFISVSTTAPTPTGTGTKGEVRYVSGYRYECTATNTWIRTAMDVTW